MRKRTVDVMDEDDPNGAGPSTSGGTSSRLPPLATLSTWVHRPAAVAKCFLADVYSMRPLLQSGSENMRYAGRDVFMLGAVPCKMVEVVGWVSGITQRESSMVVYLDDGDGVTILPVTVKLPIVAAPVAARPATTLLEEEAEEKPAHFLSAKERKELKRKQAAEEYENAQVKKRPVLKTYERKDVRVGDTVRVRGRVDEWSRAKAGGEVQWVRELVVEEGSGGSIVAVHPEEQFEHTQLVLALHATKYVEPFEMPPLSTNSVTNSPSASPSKANKTTASIMDSMDISSDLPSELSVVDGGLSLRVPSELRSSQLTDGTFRQYLLDHISQAVSMALAAAEEAGPSSVQQVLGSTFPEYASRSDKGKQRMDERILRSTSPNSQHVDLLTPRPGRLYKTHIAKSPPALLSSPSRALQPWTISSILDVPHLEELARLVVDNEAKKEERRRRRRIRDGQARQKDHDVEHARTRAGRKGDDWHLSASEKERRMQKLVGWCIRSIHEDGGLVQIDLRECPGGDRSLHQERSESMVSTTSSMWSNSIYKHAEDFGYIPLTSPLVLPLLLPLFAAEREKRSRVFISKTDPRHGSGMTVAEALSRLRAWGADGRWERVGEWVVEEAIELGVRRGVLCREGRGWWVSAG